MQVTGRAEPAAATLGLCAVAETGLARHRPYRHIRHLRHQHDPGRVVAVVVEQHAAQVVGQDVVLPLRATRAHMRQRPQTAVPSVAQLPWNCWGQALMGINRRAWVCREDPSQRVGHLSEAGPQPEARVRPKLARWLRRGGDRLRLALQQLVEEAHRLHFPRRLALCALRAPKQDRQPGWMLTGYRGILPARVGPFGAIWERLLAPRFCAPAIQGYAGL